MCFSNYTEAPWLKVKVGLALPLGLCGKKECRVDEVLERAGKEVIKHGDCSAVSTARCPSYTCSRTMTEVTAYQRRANEAFCQDESEEQTPFPTSVAVWLGSVMQGTRSEANSIVRLMVVN